MGWTPPPKRHQRAKEITAPKPRIGGGAHMDTTRVAVDLAKSVFQVAVSSVPGRIDQHQRLSRERFERFFAQRESTDVLMEACGMAHHWGRHLEALGHRVWLLPPADVARYRDGNKTDRADTVAILEAGRNEAIDPSR